MDRVAAPYRPTISRRRLAAVAALWLMVMVLAVAVERGWTIGFDRAVLRAMGGGPVWPWWVASRLGDTVTRLVLAGLVAAWLAWRRQGRRALALAAGVLGALALNEAAKVIVTRARPDILPHLDRVASFSFPSGHSAGAMALGLSLALFAVPVRWRTAAVAAALGYALAVGLSRMALAVHWPSDVAAGWATGAGWVLLVATLADRWRHRA